MGDFGNEFLYTHGRIYSLIFLAKGVDKWNCPCLLSCFSLQLFDLFSYSNRFRLYSHLCRSFHLSCLGLLNFSFYQPNCPPSFPYQYFSFCRCSVGIQHDQAVSRAKAVKETDIQSKNVDIYNNNHKRKRNNNKQLVFSP